jgi:hypothetical protein
MGAAMAVDSFSLKARSLMVLLWMVKMLIAIGLAKIYNGRFDDGFLELFPPC